MRKFLQRLFFRDALLVRDKAIKILQQENRMLALELALIKARRR